MILDGRLSGKFTPGGVPGVVMFDFIPIGYVENDIKEVPADPEGFTGTVSRIGLLDEFAAGLYRLEEFKRVYIIFVFDRSRGYELVVHPRGDVSRPKRGVFATRSPYRPNPIGLSLVDLVGVDNNVLTVRGLDAVDGTPVLDIKMSRR
jgi:tRNA (adenine37-N6)-methyltransferase